MSSLFGICLSVCVFYGNCLYSNAETVESTSRDWKQMVETRLMKLENELTIQRKENKRIKAENVLLRNQFQESKDRENELLKKVWEMKSNIEELIKSQNHPAKNYKKYPQMETGVTGTNHMDVEPGKRIVPPTSTMNTDPIAFYSFISADTTTKLQLHQTLIYDTVKINLGQGYHQDDGIFIAPRSGIYGFAWTLAVSSSGWVSTEIAINGQKYGRASADGDDGSHGYGTGFALANVNAGDHVYIRMNIAGDPVLYGDGRTSFSGWML